jgi:hypothetical protein
MKIELEFGYIFIFGREIIRTKPVLFFFFVPVGKSFMYTVLAAGGKLQLST